MLLAKREGSLPGSLVVPEEVGSEAAVVPVAVPVVLAAGASVAAAGAFAARKGSARPASESRTRIERHRIGWVACDIRWSGLVRV
jgi:hypothetical protein